MSKFTRIYFAILSAFLIFFIFFIWFFGNDGKTLIKILATIEFGLCAIAGIFVVFKHEDKGE